MEFDRKIFHVVEDISSWVSDLSLYVNYDRELLNWSAENKCKLPGINSVRGQIIALLTHPHNANVLFTRAMLDAFLSKINMESKDVIQAVNKTDQWGLVHKTYLKKYYIIPRPFTYTSVHVNKRIKFGGEITNDRKMEMVENTKAFLMKYYINVDNDQWDMGHVNPNGSNDASNLIMQPPIQRAYRDNFKFDNYGLRLCPSASELVKNIGKYYTKEEIEIIKQAVVSM